MRALIGKTFLITGNTGFKGTWISAYIKYLGGEVIGVSKSEDYFLHLNLKKKYYDYQYMADLANKDAYYSLRSIINGLSTLQKKRHERPDYILHPGDNVQHPYCRFLQKY